MAVPLAASVILFLGGIRSFRVSAGGSAAAWEYLVWLTLVWGAALPLLGMLLAGGVHPPAAFAKRLAALGVGVCASAGSIAVLLQHTYSPDIKTGFALLSVASLLGLATGIALVWSAVATLRSPKLDRHDA